MTTEAEITLCSLRAVDDGARVLLTLRLGEGERERTENLAIFTTRITKLPAKGRLTVAEYRVLSHAASVSAAIELGLRLLSFSGASKRMLMQKMLRRGVSPSVAEEAVDELLARGSLKEDEGALREAEKGLLKLWGNRRILADVRAKGYDANALALVKERLLTENAVKRCEKLIARRHMALPHDAASAARFAAALSRYGYSVAEIKKATGGFDIDPFMEDV